MATGSEKIQVLMIDDQEYEYELIRQILEEETPLDAFLHWEQDGKGGLNALISGAYHVCLLDQNLGRWKGLELLEQAKALGKCPPVIMLTGEGDRALDLAAMEAGAVDFLDKAVFSAEAIRGGHAQALLERALRYALERQRIEDDLKARREQFRTVLNQLRLGVLIIDESQRVLFMNRVCGSWTETNADKPAKRTWRRLLGPDDETAEALARSLREETPSLERIPLNFRSPSGRAFWTEVEVHIDPQNTNNRILFLYDVSEVHHLRARLNERSQFADMIGVSSAMQEVFNRVQRLASLETTVLIGGETGTGKELVARALHSQSARKQKPFIPVNCAGLSESILGSQLFGHRRGSFTGAVADQAGVFEAANGGVIFLDEIGDIPLSVQTSLLRVLQEREVTRLGETRPRKVDVRIIVATRRDLAKEVEKGVFREDLLYRIRVARVDLPPLRDRRADIPLLVESFIAKQAAIIGCPPPQIERGAMKTLIEHDWPGNVRELQNAVESALVMASEGRIRVQDLPPEIHGHSPKIDWISDPKIMTRDRLLTALEDAGGNRSKAARLLGIGRSTLYRYLHQYQMGKD